MNFERNATPLYASWLKLFLLSLFQGLLTLKVCSPNQMKSTHISPHCALSFYGMSKTNTNEEITVFQYLSV